MFLSRAGGAARAHHRLSRAVMLPKVESESLGLARSHGEQGHMPGNMQGKRHICQIMSAMHLPSLLHIMLPLSITMSNVNICVYF